MSSGVGVNELLAQCAFPREREAETSEVLAAGDFRIDLASRRATVRGQELQLNQEEFEVLVFLIGHPTSIITPHTRLTTRWGGNHVRQADFLRVMAQLRKKLEAMEGCGHYLRTEPWIVYRFDPQRNDPV